MQVVWNRYNFSVEGLDCVFHSCRGMRGRYTERAGSRHRCFSQRITLHTAWLVHDSACQILMTVIDAATSVDMMLQTLESGKTPKLLARWHVLHIYHENCHVCDMRTAFTTELRVCGPPKARFPYATTTCAGSLLSSMYDNRTQC